MFLIALISKNTIMKITIKAYIEYILNTISSKKLISLAVSSMPKSTPYNECFWGSCGGHLNGPL